MEGDDHGQDDVSELLAGRLAHDAADRLHDFDLALARVHEEDAVKRRHVDAFGEAAGVGEDAGLVVGRLVQEGESIGAAGGVERAVDVAGADGRGIGIAGVVGVPCRDVVNALLELLRGLDEIAERDRAAHGRAVILGELIRVGLGECPEAAEHPALLVDGEGLALGEVPDRDPGGKRFRHGQNDDAVIGEQALLDGIAKPGLVEDGAVSVFVVHGAERGGELAGAGAGALSVDLRRRCHVETPASTDRLVVVDADERRRVLARDQSACGSVSLVGDREVEGRQPVPLLRLFENARRLVGREHHRHAIGRVGFGGFRQAHRVGRRGIGEIEDIHVRGVIGAPARTSGLVVRANSEGADGEFRVVHPGAERLREQCKARHQDEHTSAPAGEGFGNPEPHEGLACATGHEQLAPRTRGFEMAEGAVDRLLLVRARRLRRRAEDLAVGSGHSPPIGWGLPSGRAGRCAGLESPGHGACSRRFSTRGGRWCR